MDYYLVSINWIALNTTNHLIVTYAGYVQVVAKIPNTVGVGV